MQGMGGDAYGTEGDDCIFGTEGDDTIWGFGGDDLIVSKSGQDTVYGGYGDVRTVQKAVGDSRILLWETHHPLFSPVFFFFFFFQDWIYGGNGNDYLYGDQGNDYIYGTHLHFHWTYFTSVLNGQRLQP